MRERSRDHPEDTLNIYSQKHSKGLVKYNTHHPNNLAEGVRYLQ